MMLCVYADVVVRIRRCFCVTPLVLIDSRAARGKECKA